MLPCRISLFLLCCSLISHVMNTNVFFVSAYGSSSNGGSRVSVKTLQNYWIDSGQILQDLDQFQALWIKVHNCVWSECAVDNNDDDGEDRDGDENWYLYRTQEFCANAAFSLYGIPKNHFSVFHCSASNYINTFFTYGGADLLLEAVGKTPKIYYDVASSNGGYNTTNSECVLLDDSGNYEFNSNQNNNNGNNNNNNNNKNNNYNNNNYGYSSTMGCSANGNFAIAKFEGSQCDGNYFLETIDNVWGYNHQIHGIKCHKIWSRNSLGVSTTTAKTILENSWSCDLDLYPNGCPDPYGKKKRYNYALQAVAHGQSPRVAMINLRLKIPLRILSYFLCLTGLGLIIFGYYVKNKDRIEACGGGVKGYIYVMMDDFETARAEHAIKRAASKASRRKSKKEKSKKKKSRSKSKTRSSRGRHHGDVEEDPSGTLHIAPTESTDVYTEDGEGDPSNAYMSHVTRSPKKSRSSRSKSASKKNSSGKKKSSRSKSRDKRSSRAAEPDLSVTESTDYYSSFGADGQPRDPPGQGGELA